MAEAFCRLIRAVIQPGFQEIVEAAAGQGVHCVLDCELMGVQPRAMFLIRPSGRSWRFELDADGMAVREYEGVYLRPLGQRAVWYDVEELQQQLTKGYARSAAAGLVKDHLRTQPG